MTDARGNKSLASESGVELRAVRRPDGAWVLKLPDSLYETWHEMLQIAARELSGTILVTRPADDDQTAESALRLAGFSPARQDTVWRIPVARVLSRPQVTTDHEIASVTSLDPDKIAELDNQIRRDIPGTEEWIGTGADIIESLDDPEFDPALYRVAKHRVTGTLDGLIRLWNRTPEPRLGCIGVTRPWRRTRLALHLFQDVARTLNERGVTHITAETDTSNQDSFVMARRQGGEMIRSTIEWKNVVPQ